MHLEPLGKSMTQEPQKSNVTLIWLILLTLLTILHTGIIIHILTILYR